MAFLDIRDQSEHPATQWKSIIIAVIITTITITTIIVTVIRVYKGRQPQASLASAAADAGDRQTEGIELATA